LTANPIFGAEKEIMDNIIIRPIEPKDNAAVAAIVRNVLTEFNANKSGTAFYDKELDNLTEVFLQPGSAYWVVEVNGVTHGCGGIYPTKGLPAGYCEMVKLYFDEEIRGKGIGKKLIGMCAEAAIKLGYTHMYLETMPELTIAVPLYEKLGFRHINAALGNSGHCGCNMWMVKELGN
jgi:putative acetyltransferase